MIDLSLKWRHNECDGLSNRRRFDCLVNHLFRTDQRTHQSSESLAFWVGVGVGIHWWPVDSPHKVSVTRKTCSFDDVVMWQRKIVNKMDHWKFTQMSFRKRNCNNRCNLLRDVSLLIIYMYDTHFVFHASINRNSRYFDLPGPRLNIKTVLSTYGDFHVKDKTAVRTSYL